MLGYFCRPAPCSQRRPEEAECRQPQPPGRIPPANRRRAIVGGAIGHAIEFFDFTIYGFLALLGPLGDRIGRKRVLVLVLVLGMMSGCSVLIGLLPSYASIGIAAPVLLVALRCLQGFSAGGEYASGSAFLLEYAGRGRRGFGLSWITFASTVGLSVGIAVVTATTAIVGTDNMNEWGWRVPFLTAAPLAGIALYIRFRLEDTPEFTELAEQGNLDPHPVRTLFSRQRPLWLITGIGAFHAAGFYVVFTYLPTYIGTVNKYGATFSLIATLVTAVAVMVTLPTVASLSDRVGRRPILLVGSITFAVLTYPVFLLITFGNPVCALPPLLISGATVSSNVPTSTKCSIGSSKRLPR